MLFVMAGLNLVDLIDTDLSMYSANAITRHMVAMPSAQHGALHLSVTGSFLGFGLSFADG